MAGKHPIVKDLESVRLPVYVVDAPPISSGHATTEELIREVEVIRWRVADAEREWGPQSLEAQIAAHLVAGERKDIEAELHRRFIARAMWSAPRWPDREPDRRAEWDEVKRRTDILDLAHKLLGEGRKKGPATWFRCFAHEDQTPSLAVYPETQHFHTFCCSMHGDCIDLARHALRLTSFQATMAVLAEWAGVTNRTVAIAKDGEIVEVQP
jgi:hypothetical protein